MLTGTQQIFPCSKEMLYCTKENIPNTQEKILGNQVITSKTIIFFVVKMAKIAHKAVYF